MQTIVVNILSRAVLSRQVVRTLPALRYSVLRTFSEATTSTNEVKTEVTPKEPVAATTEEKKPAESGSKGSVLDFHRTWIEKMDENGKVYYQNKDTLEIAHALDTLVPTAPRWKRICAGAIDLCFSGAVGMGVYFLATLEMGDLNIGLVICAMYTSLTFLLRDSIFENKTRSLGKRLMKLEIITKDGKISGPIRNAFRNIYALPLALQSFLPPPIMAPFSLFLLADFGCFLGIKRRILEYPLGTRVICEQPDRAARLKVYKEDNEEKDRKEALESSGMYNSMSNYNPDDPNKSTMSRYM